MWKTKDCLVNEFEELTFTHDLNVRNVELSNKLKQLQEIYRKRHEENT
jgi:hypothetical protein